MMAECLTHAQGLVMFLGTIFVVMLWALVILSWIGRR